MPQDSLRFTSFEVDVGLSQSSVYALAQDSLGFLWVGTHDGLDRFDGVEFVSHRVPKGGVLDNRVQVLAARGTQLWVLSHGGLHLRDMRRGAVERLVASTEMSALATGRGGGVWAGVRDSVLVVDEQGIRGAFHVPAWVRALHEDARGRLWIGTDEGLYVLVRGNLRGPWAREQQVLAFAEPQPGTVWVGTTQQAFQMDESGNAEVVLARGVRAFATSVRGRVWASTQDGRLFVLERPGVLPREIPLPFQRGIVALLEDRSGTLWIGTDGGGLIRVDAAARPVQAVLPGPPLSAANLITSLAETPDGRIWAGSPAEGLHVLDQAGRFSRIPLPGLADEPVPGVFADDEGRLWAGTRSGLFLLSEGRFDAVPVPWFDGIPRAARVFVNDAEGGLWMAAGAGFYYRPRQGAFENRTQELGGLGRVLALHRGPSGATWGTTLCAGIVRLVGGLVEHRYTPPDCRLRGSAVVEEGPRRLWVATSEGLYTFDPHTGAFEVHPLPLPATQRFPYLYSLLRDAAGGLWMGTNSGLLRYDPARGTVRRFTRTDGLSNEELNAGAALQTSDGRLVFGTVNGLSIVGRDHLRAPTLGPAVTFTALTRFDEPVTGEPDINLRERLVLTSRQTVFSLRFAALGLGEPARARYRYRMDVLDSAWVDAGAGREARYTNLPPGEHRFAVQAAGAEGVWGPERALALYVVPSLWQRTWFRVLLGLLGLSGIVLTVRTLTTRRVRRRLRALEVEQRVAGELEQERARIAADVHDQVGATLTQIKLLTEVARARSVGDAPETLGQIQSAAQSAVEELDAIVWALDATHDGLEHFSDYLCMQAETLCAHADLVLRLDVPPAWPEGHLSANVRHPVFLAVREALCNSVRHARARTLHLRFAADAACICIEVEDDGDGFDAACPGRDGHGLINMRRRIEGVGGTVEITTAPGAGTCVAFSLPLHPEKIASLGNGRG